MWNFFKSSDNVINFFDNFAVDFVYDFGMNFAFDFATNFVINFAINFPSGFVINFVIVLESFTIFFIFLKFYKALYYNPFPRVYDSKATSSHSKLENYTTDASV